MGFAHEIPRHKTPKLTLNGTEYFVAAFGFSATKGADTVSHSKAFVLAVSPKAATFSRELGYRRVDLADAKVLEVDSKLIPSEWDVT